METNPYDAPEAKNAPQTPNTGRRVIVGCAVAALICLACGIAFFTVCTIVVFNS